MRQWVSLFLGLILVTSSVVESAAPGPEALPSSAGFSEDFESGDLSGWEVDPQWTVVTEDGGHLFEGREPGWARRRAGSWGDVTVRLKARVLSEALHINLRMSDAGRYFVGFGSDFMYIRKEAPRGQFTTLQADKPVLMLDKWHDVVITLAGGRITVAADGQGLADVTDPNPLPAGGFALETTHPGSHVHVDDLIVQAGATAPAAPAASPTVAPLPPTPQKPTQAATPAAAPAPAKAGREMKIGVIYSITGRVAEWGQEGLPFVDLAEADLNASPEAQAAGVRFRTVVRGDETTPEGARAALEDLYSKENVRVVVGLPFSSALSDMAGRVNSLPVLVISASSTGVSPPLLKKDLIYRLMPPETHLARRAAAYALSAGYKKAIVFERDEDWGHIYGAEIEKAFAAHGYPVGRVSIEPTHPNPRDYAAEVAAAEQKAAAMGDASDLVMILVVWEGEDLNIMDHASRSPTLSKARWLTALGVPALESGCFGGKCYPGLQDVMIAHKTWVPEGLPATNPLVTRLWGQVTQKLGRAPRYEHVYLYDAVQVAGRAMLAAGSDDPVQVAAALGSVVQSYQGATGRIVFDDVGDRASGDIAWNGLVKTSGGYKLHYFAFDHSDTGQLEILPAPQPRRAAFCPEC